MPASFHRERLPSAYPGYLHLQILPISMLRRKPNTEAGNRSECIGEEMEATPEWKSPVLATHVELYSSRTIQNTNGQCSRLWSDVLDRFLVRSRGAPGTLCIDQIGSVASILPAAQRHRQEFPAPATESPRRTCTLGEIRVCPFGCIDFSGSRCAIAVPSNEGRRTRTGNVDEGPSYSSAERR